MEYCEKGFAEQRSAFANARQHILQIIENEPELKKKHEQQPVRYEQGPNRDESQQHGVFGCDTEDVDDGKELSAAAGKAEAVTHVFQAFTGPTAPDGGADGGGGESDSDSSSEDDFRAHFRPSSFLMQELGSRLTTLPGILRCVVIA